MDKQQLLGYFQDHYLSRQDVLFKLPLNISIDSFWQDLVNQRKARATMLPLYSATGQPYWFVTTDKMVRASERLCEEAMKHDSFFDPYRIPLSQALTSALSQEAYFTSFVEGADYPIQAAVDFLRRGSEPENAYEQNIMNNYQAGSYLLSALSIPFDEGFVKELAAMLTDGQGGYRTTDTPGIPAMEGEPYMVPPAHMLADRMGQYYAFLADLRVHPLIKAAVGQAYILTTRPFQEANERLGRLISNAVLLRYGYDFFLDISISAYIARESYRYFKAMREIIRSDNDGDLTYFVEYYLELLVRALDGTRMEEAERLQSQLESERKMALQPLKQPTVQYTQPHSYNAEAVARVIDNAESSQDAEDGGDASQVEHGVESHHAVDNDIDGTAPDPPILPGGDASYRSSQSQAGSTQGDSEIAAPCAAGNQMQGAPGWNAVEATSPSGGTCPQLLGLPMELMTRIGKMLDEGTSPFTSTQWGEVTGLTKKEAAAECRNMSMLLLADRTLSEQRFLYTFRFSREEYLNAVSAVSHDISSGEFERILTTIEQSEISNNKMAVEYIRYCCSEHIKGFYAGELRNWCSLPQSDANTAIVILEERGVIQKPGNGKYRIMMPQSKKNRNAPERELLQAVVAFQEPLEAGIPQGLMEKLNELAESPSTTEKRIGKYIPQYLREGRFRITYIDWMKTTKMSESVSSADLNALACLGLARKIRSEDTHEPIVYELIWAFDSGILWDDLTPATLKVLDCIVRTFGSESFSFKDLEQVTGIAVKNLSYYLKILRLRSIISVGYSDGRGKVASLAVPVEEAVEHLREMGFDYIALVG